MNDENVVLIKMVFFYTGNHEMFRKMDGPGKYNIKQDETNSEIKKNKTKHACCTSSVNVNPIICTCTYK